MGRIGVLFLLVFITFRFKVLTCKGLRSQQNRSLKTTACQASPLRRRTSQVGRAGRGGRRTALQVCGGRHAAKGDGGGGRALFLFLGGINPERMNRFKPHIALLICNIVWAMDHPFYNIVLPRYVHPITDGVVSGR